MSPERPTYIYALFDPREPEHIRYVGKTVDLGRRISKHRNDHKRSKTTHHHNWLRKLNSAGVKFGYTIIDVVFNASWAEREIYWIAYYRELGRLTNSTDGGEGSVGWVPSDETRARMSVASTGRTPSAETRAKLRAAHTGKVISEKTREKLRAHATGRSRSAETRAKIGAANVGKVLSEETRAKLIESQTGTPKTKLPVGRSGVRYVHQRSKSFLIRIPYKKIMHNFGSYPTVEEAAKLVPFALATVHALDADGLLLVMSKKDVIEEFRLRVKNDPE